MAIVTCPDCGHGVSDGSPSCVQCGRVLGGLPSAATHSPRVGTAAMAAASHRSHAEGQVVPGAITPPLFPVATHKFITLSICTFGIYELYWCYQNWKWIRSASAGNISPFWRTFFAPVWGFSLFRTIRAAAQAAGVPVAWNSAVLAALFLILQLTALLPDPWWLISFAMFVPMIPVQQAAKRLNELHFERGAPGRNDNYSGANLATLAIGGLFLVLVLIGAFLPQ